MQQWKDRGCPIGAFWVWDTDGWAYWADKLEPGEATGLLLSGIRRRESPGEKMYYAIHVVAQFCTDGDWGAPADGDTPASGFYDPDNGAPMSDDALALLKQAMELIVGADGEKYKDYGDNTFQQYLHMRRGGSDRWNCRRQERRGSDRSAESKLWLQIPAG